MKEDSRLFWGSRSPLACLAGGGILVMASCRLAYAILCAGALLWIYGISVLSVFPARRFFPRRGVRLILVALCSLSGSLYLLLIWFVNPLLGMEVFFIVNFSSLVCLGSGIFERIKTMELGEAVPGALSEAAVLAFLIIALALIREPLGYLSLSLPGGRGGIVLLFSSGAETILPIRIFASSSGALLLLGYGTGLYRYFKNPREEDNP
jgi:hypothetical protein